MQVIAIGWILNVSVVVLKVPSNCFQSLIILTLIFPAIPVDIMATSWHQRIRYVSVLGVVYHTSKLIV